MNQKVPEKFFSFGQVSHIDRFAQNFAEIENISNTEEVMNVAIQSWVQDQASLNKILDGRFTDASVNMQCQKVERPIRTIMSQITSGYLSQNDKFSCDVKVNFA